MSWLHEQGTDTHSNILMWPPHYPRVTTTLSSCDHHTILVWPPHYPHVTTTLSSRDHHTILMWPPHYLHVTTTLQNSQIFDSKPYVLELIIPWPIIRFVDTVVFSMMKWNVGNLWGKAAHHFSSLQSLVSLCELRSTANFPYTAELDSAFGAAVASMGPRWGGCCCCLCCLFVCLFVCLLLMFAVHNMTGSTVSFYFSVVLTAVPLQLDVERWVCNIVQL